VIAQTISHYRIIKQLGAGGMGEVYLAEDTQLGRPVAIKLLLAETISDEHAKKRLVREARAAATLDHPNICSVYEVGEADGRSFIAMQYIEGETLDARIKRQPLELKGSLHIASQVADALAEAHAHGIIHRDIKPSNIIITARGQAKVMDFGLAKAVGAVESEAKTQSLLTTPGTVIGTVPYMSPEQLRGENLDARTDIFSFGVVLYEMLSGRQPFASESAAATASAILTHEPPPLARYALNVPDELQRIVRKCLEKDRERRCQTMRDVALDLENVLRENESMQDVQRSSPEQQVTGPAAETADRGRKWRDAFTSWRALLVAALGITLVVAAVVYTRRFRGVPTTAAPEIKSLAVLPLDNLSGDPEQDYFAEGMTEALITGLAKVSALRVISRTSVMQYKGTRKTVPEIARELNVDAIIEGSVQRAGERVQITAQLIQAATDQHLWAGTYGRDLKDVLSLQNEVAGTIVREIQIKLTPQEQAQLANVRSVNPEAYDNYLRGKFHAERENRTDNETAIKLLEKAVEIDPNFARAYAELARAYNTKAFFFAPQEKQWEEKAFVAVEKALALNPDLAEAHLARGRLLWTHTNHFPHESAMREYQRALALNPNLDEAHHQLALVYGHIGLLDEAIQGLQKAVAINPTNSLARFRVGAYLSYQGKYEQALPIYDSVPRETNPTLGGYQTAWVLFQLGRKQEASARVEELLREYPRDEGGGLASMQALLFAAAGEERKAEEKIKTAIKTGQGFGHFHHTAYFIASAYALMNKHEPAIVWLQNAADDGFPCYPLFESDANLNNLRQDPQFINFMAKQKEQWQHRKAAL
jgi:TolB-like protein/Tfp pilus assembly protein PilF/predicted Ser/Thr protein kinase